MQLGPERFKANAQAALADRTLKIAIDRTTGTAERKRAEAVAERGRTRRSKPPYEREQNREEQVGTSAGARDPIQLVVRELEKPVEIGADPALIEKQLEGHAQPKHT